MNSNERSTKPHEGDSDGKDGCALTVGSLFSGIGGLDLGFERAGFNIAWQCEKDSYCQKVLSKHWPNTPCYDNIEDLHRADGPQPDADILIGGFPCQDISQLGERDGIYGDKSSLWWEYHRLISVVRPEYAIVENLPALATRGLREVLGSLAALRYDAEWQIVSAASVGAPHIRERLFIVAYPHSRSTKAERRVYERQTVDAARENREWIPEPDVDRVVDGASFRLERRRGCGNAVVPQQAEVVAECVREHAERTRDQKRQTERLDADVPTDARR